MSAICLIDLVNIMGVWEIFGWMSFIKFKLVYLSGTIIRGTLKSPNSQLVTPISTKLQRPDGCD
jgi:hypothetical protein